MTHPLTAARLQALCEGDLPSAAEREHLGTDCEHCETLMVEAPWGADRLDGELDAALLTVSRRPDAASPSPSIADLGRARFLRAIEAPRRRMRAFSALGALAASAALIFFVAKGPATTQSVEPGAGGGRLKGAALQTPMRLEFVLLQGEALSVVPETEALEGAEPGLAGTLARENTLLLRIRSDQPRCGALQISTGQHSLLSLPKLCIGAGVVTLSQAGAPIAIDLSDPELLGDLRVRFSAESTARDASPQTLERRILLR